MPRAKWSTKRADIKSDVRASGEFVGVFPLADAGTPVLTVTVTVTPEREVQVFVHGEPGAALTGFTAWSDI